MKSTLIPYYGGKFRISEWIVSHFPYRYQKMHYVEPFAGGLSVFFRKEKCFLESVNDINYGLFILYKMLRENHKELFRRIDSTLYSENDFKYALDIYNSKIECDDITKAWAVFTAINLSFAGTNSTFGYFVRDSRIMCFNLRRKIFKSLKDRFSRVQIFNRKAEWFIDRFKDEDNVLMYLDPPYPDVNQSPYKDKFSIDEFNIMLDKLYSVKFKFLLSFYENKNIDLSKFNTNKKFSINKYKAYCSTSKDKKSDRTECLLINYNDNPQQKSLL